MPRTGGVRRIAAHSNGLHLVLGAEGRGRIPTMYAVIGATGKVGGAVVRTLRQRGIPVRAVVRDRAKAAGLLAAGCEIAVAELHDAAAVRAALSGTTRVHVILPMRGTASDGLADADSI